MRKASKVDINLNPKLFENHSFSLLLTQGLGTNSATEMQTAGWQAGRWKQTYDGSQLCNWRQWHLPASSTSAWEQPRQHGAEKPWYEVELPMQTWPHQWEIMNKWNLSVLAGQFNSVKEQSLGCKCEARNIFACPPLGAGKHCTT